MSSEVAFQDDRHVADLLTELLRRTHLSRPADLPRVVAEVAGSIGAVEVDLYLVDYGQEVLLPLRGRTGGPVEPLSIAGTVAGRAFSLTTVLEVPRHGAAGRRVWVPLLDGTERLGVLGLSFARPPLADRLLAVCERYAHLVAMLVIAKGAYGDVFEVARRREPMTIASELLWSLAPPLVYATDRLVLAGMLEPCYDNGGDLFDYAIDDGLLHLAVLDAMGHGLAAAGVAAFVVAAYRRSRRIGLGLLETYEAMDTAVAEQFDGERFVTAVIATLEVETGRLSWTSAGHPPPLLIRDARRSRTLAGAPATPLGAPAGAPPEVVVSALEPGDMLLLYTDGLTEARGPQGDRFGVEGLNAFIEREAASGLTVPETLRRLRHALAERGPGRPEDDATALLVSWQRGDERALLPPTVRGPAD
jgi:hypothetical protein